MAIKVVIAGVTGWVGRALVPVILAEDDLLLAGAVARKSAGQDAGHATGLQMATGVTVSATLEEALATPSDVVVDYTTPEVVKANALLSISKGRHVVIGTSGLGADDYSEIDAAAKAAGVGVLAAGNFSITATLLKRFALMAAKYVPDVEIIDYAGARKPDAPSGTARELAEGLAQMRRPATSLPQSQVLGVPAARGGAVGQGGGVQVHSLRLPSYILSCEAIFGLPDERLSIRHDAGASAAPYVAGTLLAMRRVGTMKGLVRGLDSLME